MISMERELLHFPMISLKIQFLAIFGHFLPFVPAHGQPLDPTSPFTNITIITGCCCNDIYGERATPDYYHSIPTSEAWKLNNWPFSAIFHDLSLLLGDPLIASLLLLS